MHTIKQENTLLEKVIEQLFSANATEDNPLTEQQLAQTCGVSRTPIRDVLKGLEKEGMVERRKKKGVYLKILSLSEIVALHDVRSVLEGFAARLAKANITEKDLTELERLAQKYREARQRGDLLIAREADIAFHKMIVRLSCNCFLSKIMSNFALLERVFRMQLSSQLPAGETSPPPCPHEKIVKTFKTGSEDECEIVVRSHAQWSKQSLIEESLGQKLKN